MQILLFLTNVIFINLGFLISFWLRYGLPFPKVNFSPYKNSFVFLMLIYMWALAVFGVIRFALDPGYPKGVFDVIPQRKDITTKIKDTPTTR